MSALVLHQMSLPRSGSEAGDGDCGSWNSDRDSRAAGAITTGVRGGGGGGRYDGQGAVHNSRRVVVASYSRREASLVSIAGGLGFVSMTS